MLIIEIRNQIPTGVRLSDDLQTSTAHANQQLVVLGYLLDFPILYAVPPYMLNILAIPEQTALHYDFGRLNHASYDSSEPRGDPSISHPWAPGSLTKSINFLPRRLLSSSPFIAM